jgi:hypothetical protein
MFSPKESRQVNFPPLNQGCQIFLGPNIPKRKKYTKGTQTIPKGFKLHQMAVEYSKWS